MTDPVKSLCKYLYELLIFIGKFSAVLPYVFVRRKMRWKDVGYYLDQCGSRSLPIVLVICGLMGIILGIQAALQMKKFGTEIYVADLVGFSILKSGASFAAKANSHKNKQKNRTKAVNFILSSISPSCFRVHFLDHYLDSQEDRVSVLIKITFIPIELLTLYFSNEVILWVL